MRLAEIANLCGAAHRLAEARAVAVPCGFAIDSRAVRANEIFVAIPGERVDGHQFVKEVLDKGALAAIVVHHRLPFSRDLAQYKDRLLFVTDTAAAFQRMAEKIVAAWNRPVVAVTASAGKTTIKDLIAHVLEGSSNRIFKSLGNLNTSYGLPLTVGRMISGGTVPDDFDVAVFEFGMSSYGEIRRLTEIAPPSVSVVGNVGTAHIEFFGSSDGIAEAKAEIIDGLRPGGTAVLNADDARVTKMSERCPDATVIRFGIENKAEISASDISDSRLGAVKFILSTPEGKAEVSLGLLGRHNVYNALAAAAVGHRFGMTAAEIAERLGTAEPSKMRGEILRFSNGVTVIDDSYNSNPPALIQAVQAVAGAEGYARRIVVAGEMLELGDAASEMHRGCGRDIAMSGVDLLIGVRGLARELVDGASHAGMKGAVYCETPEQAAQILAGDLRTGDLVLVKGSRGVRTEKVIEGLKSALGEVGSRE